MPKKHRCSSCSTGWCRNHLLQLIPLSNQLYYRKNFKIRLCPRYNKQNNTFEKIIPLFNKDKKYYTPSFYLDQQKKYYDQNDERVLRNHNLKTYQDAKSRQNILIPRHARKRNYCFVCKSDYNDYLDHLGNPLHKKFLRNNQFTPFILEIQQKFVKQCKIQPEQKKQQDLKRQAPTQQSSSISEQTQKSFQFIRKLIKLNEEADFFQKKQQVKQGN